MAEVRKMTATVTMMDELRSHSDDIDLQPGLVRHISHTRLPIYLTTSVWRRDNKYIKLYVNPSTAQWSLPRRESVTKTAAGAVRNVWPNRFRRTIYDEGTVSFTFQSGNLMPGANIDPAIFGQRTFAKEAYATLAPSPNPFAEGVDEFRETFDETVAGESFGGKKKAEAKTFSKVKNVYEPGGNRAFEIATAPPVPQGLLDFYRFLDMLNQPMVSWTGENRHFIIYRSRVFPSITLEGYFTGDAISFTEDASAANRIQWNATFQIYKSSPPWWDSEQLRTAYVDNVRASGMMSEIFGGRPIPKPQVISATPSDPDNPYQSLDMISPTGEPPAAVMHAGEGKTADKVPAVLNPPSDIYTERISTVEKLLSGFVGLDSPPGSPYAGKPFVETPFYTEMMKSIQTQYATAEPPPTLAELNTAVERYLATKLDSDMSLAYTNVLSVYLPESS